MNINSVGMSHAQTSSEASRSRQAAGGSSFAETFESQAGLQAAENVNSQLAAVMGPGAVLPLKQDVMTREPSSVLSQEEKNFFELYTARKYLSESEMQFFNNAALGGKAVQRSESYGRAYTQPAAHGALSLQA